MTALTAALSQDGLFKGGLGWLRSRDANLLALRRAGPAAIFLPGPLGLTIKVIGNPGMATFAAFGSLSMLLFVAFGGRMRERLPDQIALIVTGAVFVVLGTLASRTTWLAALALLVVAFFVLSAGVVSSALASASFSMLLAFILPVSLRAPVSQIPDRLAGWLLAGAASLIAIRFLWPAPPRPPPGGAGGGGRAARRGRTGGGRRRCSPGRRTTAPTRPRWRRRGPAWRRPPPRPARPSAACGPRSSPRPTGRPD